MAPTPKRSFFPFFLVFSLSGLFLFSLYLSSSSTTSTTHLQVPSDHSSPTFFNQNPSQPTSVHNDNKFTLTIKVLTFDRIASLTRCLRSLASAQYGGDRVNLHIFVDHFKNMDPGDKGFANLDAKLNESRQILDFVDGFSWEFGEKLVHYRTGNVGLQAQWLEAWWPSSNHEFAFVVEDDLEVSPLYYKFLRDLIVNYYYNASNFNPSIYGASLQRPRFVPGKHGNKLLLDSGTHLFLYQLVGTWGQLLFPRPWKEFRLWYDAHKTKGIKPFLDGMVTNGWYKKLGEKIWTPWFIKFIHSRGYFNLYTNFSHEQALSTSHRDAGVNYGKTAGPDSSLLDEERSLDFDLFEMHPLTKLKWYDFCFREVKPNRVVKSFDELGSVLPHVERRGTIILVTLAGVTEAVTRNLLCHFERLNIRNYILVGPNSDFLLDLARRGHPVVDVEQFFETVPTSKFVEFEESRMEFVKDVVVNAYVVKKALELGYNTWVFDGNILPITGDLFLDSIDPNYDLHVGKTLRLLAIRSSSENWMENFLEKFAATMKSSEGKDMFSLPQRNFVYTATQVSGKMGLRIKKMEDTSYSVVISTSDVNRTTSVEGKKIMLWSSEMGLDFVQKRLEESGMWIIDGESSCKAVYCHKS